MIVRVDLQADADDLAKVADALAAAADQHRRAGIAAAAELERDRHADPTVDVTGPAMLVVGVLAEADMLGKWADALRTAASTPPGAGSAPQPANAALAAAAAAVAAAKAARTPEPAQPAPVPTLAELAAGYNQLLAQANGAQEPAMEPVDINGTQAWLAPEVYAADTDDDDLEPAAAADMIGDTVAALRMDMTL